MKTLALVATAALTLSLPMNALAGLKKKETPKDDFCSKLATVVESAKNDFASIRGDKYNFGGQDSWASNVMLGGTMCTIERPMFGTGALQHSCTLRSGTTVAQSSEAVQACYPGLAPAAEGSWRVAPHATVSVAGGINSTVQLTVVAGAGTTAPTAAAGGELCPAVKAALAELRTTPSKMGGAFRPKQKMNAFDYAKAPGAKDSWVEKPNGLYPEVVFTWERSDAKLAALETEVKSCLSDWSFSKGTYSGIKGSKEIGEKDTHYLELFDNALYDHLELRLKRQCLTTACFNERNPGLLDGDDDDSYE